MLLFGLKFFLPLLCVVLEWKINNYYTSSKFSPWKLLASIVSYPRPSVHIEWQNEREGDEEDDDEGRWIKFQGDISHETFIFKQHRSRDVRFCFNILVFAMHLVVSSGSLQYYCESGDWMLSKEFIFHHFHEWRAMKTLRNGWFTERKSVGGWHLIVLYCKTIAISHQDSSSNGM